MLWFLNLLILPLLEALRPRTIVEVGVEAGAVTSPLVDWAVAHQAVVHAIDPDPQVDPAELGRRGHEALRFHRCRSLEVLGQLDDVDLVLIDGDHNWYTVINELRALEQAAIRRNREPPLVLLHDVGWPYGRRDMYYDPESVPAEHRHAYERRAVAPGNDELAFHGLNGHLFNATTESTEANGVLSAIEDFVAESTREWSLTTVPGLNGIGVLMPSATRAEFGRVRDFVSSLSTPEFLDQQCQAIEARRIELQINSVGKGNDLTSARDRLSKAEDALARTADALARTEREADVDRRAADTELQRTKDSVKELEQSVKELEQSVANGEAELEQAQTEAEHWRREHRRLKRQAAETEAEREELEQQLASRAGDLRGLRTKLREMRDELDDARTGEERAQLARGEAEQALATSRRELEGKTVETDAQLSERQREVAALERQLDEALARNQRRDQEAAEACESLEAHVDEGIARLHIAQQSERQLREELAAREAEVAAAGAQRARLQDALARARVDADIAAAEREALDRRLVEATATAAWGNGSAGVDVTEQLSALLDELAVVRQERDRLASEVGARSLAQPVVIKALPPGRGPEWPPLHPSELAAQATFLGAYRKPLSATMPGVAGASLASDEDTARAAVVDRRGILVGVGEDQGDLPRVDVVMCVHDAQEDVRTCLWSLVAKTTRRFSLIIVNDGSDRPTTDLLKRFAEVNPPALLIDNPDDPHGYTIAANFGMRASRGDYVILLNSDTIVTPDWLERIVAYGEAHREVGVLGPMSNAASHQSVPDLRAGGNWATNALPPWLTPDGLAMLLQRRAPRTNTRLPFINGFCYAIKRQALDAVGLFDEENFATGYCEENDFSHRARLAGFELGVVDDAYVYHVKSSSYGVDGRKELARRNYEVFLQKHGREEIQKLVEGMEQNRSLAPVRAAIRDAISSPQEITSALAGSKTPLSIVFVLPGLGDGGSGGSHSIYQEVSGLRRLGIPARIALVARAWDRARKAYSDAEQLFETFADIDELLANTRDADVISATHFKSVEMVGEIYARRRDFLPAYYIQDYEPFFAVGDTADNHEALDSYTAVQDMLLFAKTHWLCNVVGDRHGVFVAKVMPSIDERVYQPARLVAPIRGPLRVCAMLRPRTPRRQPHSTIAVLERLVNEYGSAVDVTTFGCRDADMHKLTESERLRKSHKGMLRRDAVAALLGNNHVFLDMSMYQAFGRTALEAMACGCTALVPRIGGAWEFLEDGVNGLCVDTLDREATYAELCGLVDSEDRLVALRRAALATAARYSVFGAAISEYLLFEHEHRNRFGIRSATTSAG